MHRFWAFLTMMTAICSPAVGGSGDEIIEILIEGGVVEISVTIDPPDGPPVTGFEQYEVNGTNSLEYFFFEVGDAGASARFSLSHGIASLDITIEQSANQSGPELGATVSVCVRTIEPIIVRLLDYVQFDLDGGAGSLDPVSGVINGNTMCPGTYAITLDESLELQEFEYGASQLEDMNLELYAPQGAEVRFTGGGSAFVDGNSTDDQGNKDSAFEEAWIEGGSFSVSGCTSSGLVDGDAQSSGEISDQGNGSFEVRIDADAMARQDEGYTGSCSIGAFGDSIILALAKPKAFSIDSSGNGSISLTPTTGSINGDTLSPGRYAISFNASAAIVAGETSAVGSIDWTLQLRTPGCSAADLASPSGILDFSDVIAFLGAYGASEPAADLAPPIGVWDFTDVLAFLGTFVAGCP